MNQNKTKKEENKKTLWSQSNKTYVRSHRGEVFCRTLRPTKELTDRRSEKENDSQRIITF